MTEADAVPDYPTFCVIFERPAWHLLYNVICNGAPFVLWMSTPVYLHSDKYIIFCLLFSAPLFSWAATYITFST